MKGKSMKALIVYGGWVGHEPDRVAVVLSNWLRADGFDVEMSDTLDAFNDADKLKSLDLIVPHWTMGKIAGEQCKNLCAAVRDAGVGIAGCHGGMNSEQYYMHVDPANHVLATTTFEYNGCTMPAVWKKMYGRGRVFYSSLGHVAKDLDVPEVEKIMRRGMKWAAEGKPCG